MAASRIFLYACMIAAFFCSPNVTAASPAARKSDIPFIKCQVCEELSKQLIRQVNNKREGAKPKKLPELKIIDVAEKICDVKLDEGDWIQWFDIQEKGSTLKLVEQKFAGECNSKCKTIQRACQDIIGFQDTDVAEFLLDETNQRAALSKFLCRSLTNSCTAKVPAVPKDRKPGEPFLKKTQKDIDYQKMARDLGVKSSVFHDQNPDAPPMPKMKLYHRDDIMKKNFMAGGGEEEEEDDEDDEDDEGLGGADAQSSDPAAEAHSVADKVKQTAKAAKETMQEGVKAAKEWVGGLFGSKKGGDRAGSGEQGTKEL